MDGRSAGWVGVAILIAMAVASGLADRRRARRTDPDAVGPIAWPTVQVLALIGAAILAGLLVHD